MKTHTRLYLAHFNYGIEDFIPCECCGSRAVDIHHIEARGMGGGRGKDDIKNLMALCRSCHIKYGDKKNFKDFLIEKHGRFIKK
jgi:5-methylcytosine-specific restriction endonuclease McrA